VDGVPALLLHGTASESVEAILRDGLIPTERAGISPVFVAFGPNILH